MRQDDSRRPVWELADQVRITQSVLEAQWKALLSQPRLADCCVIVSFRSPHVLAIVVSLHRRGGRLRQRGYALSLDAGCSARNLA
jgi:hypothetical protein